MKKQIIRLACMLLCLQLCSCGNNGKEESSKKTQETTVEETTEKETEVTTEKKTEPTTKKEEYPQYIGSVSHQYDDANKQHIFFWQFLDDNKNVLKSKATIKIKIKNDNGEEVFDKTFHVDEKDYSTWSNKISSSSRILGSVTVDDSEITEGSSKKGVASLTALTTYGGFDEININVYDLPEKGVNINMPSLPATSNYYSYNGELRSTMTVTDITYENDWSLKIKLTAQMTYNSEGAEDYGRVGYKITDQNGLVVESGYAFFDKLAVGESQIKEVYVSGVNPGDNLTLQITDVE